MLKPRSFVTIGKITKPHGIKGDVTADYYADSLEYLENDMIFIKTEKSEPKKVQITSWKERGNQVLLKLKEVSSRTDAEFLRNYDLVIDADLLCYPNEDSSKDPEIVFDNQDPYLHHLLGARVFIRTTIEDDLGNFSEQEIGLIEEITFPAGQELWAIINKEQKEILFPAVPEFVDHYDLANNKVYINPPDGLLDIYLKPTEPKPKKSKGNKKSIKNS